MIETEKIAYSDSADNFEGFLAYDASMAGKRPLVLVAHTIRGPSPFEEEVAMELAGLGYVAFAIDLYGKDRQARPPGEARGFMDALNENRSLLLARMQLALGVAKSQAMVHPEKVGVIGFCFGGKCALDLARSGESLRGIVSFHGLYDPPGINGDTKMKCAVLILHGWDDPLAPPQALLALTEELTRNAAEWEVDAYGHTGHAFTNPLANMPEKGLSFHKASADKAWSRMKSFLYEQFEE